MRRSSSLSSIPLPKRQSRLSARDSALKLRPTSMDRRTPLCSNRPGSVTKRNPSLNRATDLFGAAKVTPLSSSSKLSICPSSCVKTPLSKKLNDRKWVQEQHIKVQQYVDSNQDTFAMHNINSSTIKPPSINTFLKISAVLFGGLNHRVKITKENYKEVIPQQLKVFNYPGTINNSTLKCVNTMHSFPPVMALFSWLIDKNEFHTHCLNLQELPEEFQHKIVKSKIALDFLLNSYTIFNDSNENKEELLQNEVDKFAEDLDELLELDTNKLMQLKNDIATLNDKREKQEEELAKRRNRNKDLEEKILSMEEEISNFYCVQAETKKELETELNELLEQKGRLDNEKLLMTNKLDRLQEIIKNQPCTIEEKKLLLQKIDGLEWKNSLSKDKIEKCQQIRDEYDHKLVSLVRQAESYAHEWNNSIFKLTVERPELNKLILLEKGFHSEDYLKALKEVSDSLKPLEEKYKTQLTNLKERIEELDSRKTKLSNGIKTVEDDISNNIKTTKIKNAISQIKQKISLMQEEMAAKIKQLEEQQETLMEEFKLRNEECKNKIKEFQSENEWREKDCAEFSTQSIDFFIKLNKQIMEAIEKMDKIRMEKMTNLKKAYAHMLEKANKDKKLMEKILEIQEKIKKAE